MATRRALFAVVTVFASLLGLAAPADAGGSNWEFDATAYRVGDRVFGWASVSWDHYETLGRPEDGPFGAWLHPFDLDGPERPWDTVPASAVYVADVAIHDEPYDAGDGWRYGPHHATVEFTLPDLPPGEYELIHCDTPCTTTLGDITWGSLRIFGSNPAPTTTAISTTTVAPTTTAADLAVEPLVADDSSSGSSGPLLAAGVVALGVGLGAVAWRLRPRGQATPKPA